MTDLSSIGVLVPDILLPTGCDAAKWACIACDQYTSQEDYWRQTDRLVGEAPSTLRLVLPEVYLADADARIPKIHDAMRAYAQSVLTTSIHGFVLTARTTRSGCRKGLMLAVDLEQYDYAPGSVSRVRATEGTILSRIPPRMKVRQDALLECPHIMLLLNDKERTLIEPLYEKLRSTPPLYDAELLQDCGHLAGWAVQAQEDLEAVANALIALDETRQDAPLFAVGDGNHSLASARAAWLALKATLSPAQAAVHPARWALCEVVNLYDDALSFAPIHRVLRGADVPALMRALEAGRTGAQAPVTLVTPQGDKQLTGLPIDVLQPILDAYLQEHPSASIDYVHGDEAARQLGRQEDGCALLLTVLSKYDLFPSIARGPLPRKSFSMGEAQEKRCYFECRRIR